MDELQGAQASAAAINEIPTGFMLDMGTYAKGAELGLPGMGIYTYGRGGAFGDVDADVVAAAFVMFHADTVRAAWDPCREVMAPREAAQAFLGVGEEWLAARFDDVVVAGRLADLAQRVAAAASPAAAPLFAAWRVMPEPVTPIGRAMHHVNVLRELRGGVHGACVLASGLTPLQAILVDNPPMAGIYGWPQPWPEIDDAVRATWATAEAATNRAVAPAYASLDDAERVEFAELLAAVLAAVGD